MSVLLQAMGEALLNSELLLKGAGGGAFLLYNAGTWRPHHFAVWGFIVLLGASSPPVSEWAWLVGGSIGKILPLRF